MTFDQTLSLHSLQLTENSGLAASANRAPSLRWQTSSSQTDCDVTAYEMQFSDSEGFGAPQMSSGRIPGSGFPFAPWTRWQLASREVVWVRVRAWTEIGITGWSTPLRVEGALYDDDCWLARPIHLASDRAADRQIPPPQLRKEFEARSGLRSARLYATAMGVHETRINGQLASNDLFEPGWTDYNSRLLYASHDVTHLIREGTNVIAATIGDGWWRGNLTWIPKRDVYGQHASYLAQLELTYADGALDVIGTNASWRGSTGKVIEADFYNGCTIDLSKDQAGWLEAGFDDSGWQPVSASPLPAGLSARTMPPVRIVGSVDVQSTRHGNTVSVDCGQNLTGWLKLSVRCQQPVTITVRHAEVLEPDGALHLSSLRTAKATDQYRLPEGEHSLEPHFTYHGFRYAEIDLGENSELINCTAQVVSSDLRRIGQFRCSDERVNRLYENIIWSQRGNFISIPTDCPQRDERLGWTGDIQVFASTACSNFDCRTFLSSWLEDLAIDQRSDGNVTSTVPNVIWGHPFEFAGVGWGDAATLVPWAIYEAYGDATVLASQFASMKAWVDYGVSRRGADGTWTGDFHLGDWLDPAAPSGHPELASTDRDFIATSYLALSARTLGKSASVLGKSAEAEHYNDIAAAVASAAWSKWQEQAPQTQTGCAMAIIFGIAPPEVHAALGSALAQLVLNGDGIGTGFLGTPLVLPALTQTGQCEAATSLLLDDEHPGWLYQVRKGATTVWERWDAIRPDGSIHKGDLVADDSPGMMSFNHYAYGSVGAWLYRDLAGISPAQPGYDAIAFAPCPIPGISWAEASIETPRGLAAISWRIIDASIHVKCEVPFGASAVLRIPDGWTLPGNTPAAFSAGSHDFEFQRCRT